MKVRLVNGVKHTGRCACPACDPDQKLLQQQRESAAAERAAFAKLPPAERPQAAAPRVRRLPLPPTNETRRLAQLFREGKTFAEAAQIIEAEKALRQKGPQ